MGIWSRTHVVAGDTPITFLGIDWYMDGSRNVGLTQEGFTTELLAKYSMDVWKPLRNITMDKIFA